jgi:hypothetical protein
MSATSVLNELLDPVGRFLTADSAQRLLELHAPASVQAVIDELAAKSTEGTLTAEERSDYETFVAAGTFIAILQSKARKHLKERSPG